MLSASFRFFGDLNDLLPRAQREQVIAVSLAEHAAVKHPIESLGVPHPEVAAILVNGSPVDFSYLVQDGDAVQVYPATALPPTPDLPPLRPPIPLPVRFVLDTHLGQLATYLRLLGFDTLYGNDASDHVLAALSAQEGRVLLTRDRGLLKHKIVVYGHCVRDHRPRRQVADVLRRYRLYASLAAGTRCARCNSLLEPVAKAAILDHLLPKTRLYYDDFQRCTGCGQIYWRGSHYERLARWVEEVAKEEG